MIFHPPPQPIQPIGGFEDLSPGQRFALGSVVIERPDIFDFAAIYDPQPFHLDEAAAERSIFKGLAASGFQTAAAAFSVSVRSGLLERVNLGGTGIEQMRWLKPVRPGIALGLVWIIETVTPSASRPDRAAVRIRYEVSEASGDLVATMLITHLIRSRAPAPT